MKTNRENTKFEADPSTRVKALKWWDGLFYNQQQEYNARINGSFLDWLTPDQIEELWKQELQAKIEALDDSSNYGKVDFERVKEFIELLKESHNNWVSAKATDNMILFFNLLSTKPSFGKVVYKELSKLNK